MTGRANRRGAAVLALAGAVTMVVASCSSGPGGGTADPDGVLRVGYSLSAVGTRLDPVQSTAATDSVWMSPVFGTLLRQQADGSLDPWMAESVEVVDPQTVRISLRDGTTFADGTPYDAEAIKVSLMRARAAPTPLAQASQTQVLRVIDGVEVVDPTTAVVRLSQPLAGQLLVELSQRGGMIVSPRQVAENPAEINTKPVGAGPFRVAEYVPDRSVVYDKNPAYWDAAGVELGGVEFVDTPRGGQQANGLLSGTLDVAPLVTLDSIDTIEASGFATNKTPGPVVNLVMCTGKAPFDNEDVRKAVQVGIDRQRFADVAYGGHVDPATSFTPDSSTQFNPRTQELLAFDLGRARQLLAESGLTETSFELHYPAPVADLAPAADVIQSQLKAIGFNATVVADRDVNAAFMAVQTPGMMITPVFTTGLDLFSRHLTPGSPYALCGVGRPDVMDFVNQAYALDPADPAAVEAVQKAQELMAEHAYVIPVSTYPIVASWSEDRIGDSPKFTSDGFIQLDSVQLTR